MADTERDWLTSTHRNMVETHIATQGHMIVDQALRVIATNFSPEECADIVLAAFRRIVDDPQMRESIMDHVKLLQASR